MIKKQICKCGCSTFEVIKREGEDGSWERCSECKSTYDFSYIEVEK